MNGDPHSAIASAAFETTLTASLAPHPDSPVDGSIVPFNSSSNPPGTIDLTVDESPSRNHTLSYQAEQNQETSDLGDDVIFTGQNLPPGSSLHLDNRRNAQAVTRRVDIGRRSMITQRFAELSAGIYAGFYSSNPTPPRNDAGPSNITIRDSPPLLTRRPRSNPTSTFGGGGRFSGGHFSGLLNVGLEGLRGFSSGARLLAGETLEEMLNSWNDNGRRTSSDDDFEFGTDMFIPFDVDPRLLAAFSHEDQINTMCQESINNCYHVNDSHPKKIKAGFSKEIIPLDREVLNLEDDSVVQVDKLELRPICASCDQELLIGQDSSVDGNPGRRPWILKCGHVVDSICLEMAKARALEACQQKKTKNKGNRVTSAKGRTQRQPGHHTLGLSPHVIGTTHRNLSLGKNEPVTVPHPDSVNSTQLDCAVKRRERAIAREARKSVECPYSRPRSGTTTAPTAKTTCSAQIAEPEIPPFSASRKGKGRVNDVQGPSQLAAILSENRKSTVNPLGEPLPLLSSTWTQCPVKDCRGVRGDLLAALGSKSAPWEMFV